MGSNASFTSLLDAEQQTRLAKVLRDGNYRLVDVPYTTVAADGEACRIALYNSGKCCIQGKGARTFVEFVLEPEILRTARLGYEELLDPARFEPHLGVDESGKGDFFGPLVIAAAYVDRELIPVFDDLGVRDSKKIASDRRLLETAAALRQRLGVRYAVVAISPRRYNELYAKMRSVNTILAWGHARALENALEKLPGCKRAISDQFGSASLVTRALLQRGRQIEFVQYHKAESDPAVAAASILAREGFLLALRRIGETYKTILPKGASGMTRSAAVELVKQHGPQVLLETVKCHFKTTDEVLAAAGHTRADLGAVGTARSRSYLPPAATDGGNS